MLRWPHDHHRDLRARLSAQAQSGIDQDRLLMTPSPLIDDRTRTNPSRRRVDRQRPRSRQAAILSALTLQTSPRNAPPARQSPYSPAERLPQPLQSKLIKPAAATKSPKHSRHRRHMFHRDFVPWRFSDAARISTRLAHQHRRPKTCTRAAIQARAASSPLPTQFGPSPAM